MSGGGTQADFIMDRLIHNACELPTNETNLRKLYDSKKLKKLVDEIESWSSEEAIPVIASGVFLSSRQYYYILCPGWLPGGKLVAPKEDNIQLSYFFYSFSYKNFTLA